MSCPRSFRRAGRWGLAKQCSCLLFILTLLAPCSLLSAQEEKRDGSFGFDGKRIFKFNRGVGPVLTTDLNGDGRQDIVVVDNYRAELVLLLQDPEAEGETSGKGPNALADGDGFVRQEVPLKRKIVALSALDLDADRRNELIMLSQGMLSVWWGDEQLTFRDKTTVRLRDVLPDDDAIAFDRSGSNDVDLYLLGRKGVYVLSEFRRDRAPQQKELPSSAGNSEAIFLVDVDGDSDRDLVTVVDDREHPYHVRLRLPGELGFGPEVLLAGDRPAAVSTLEGPSRTRLLSLGLGQARFDVLQLSTKTSNDPLDLPGPEIYPLDAAGVTDAKFLVDDVDGDGDVDVIVAHNGDSTLRTFLNQKGELTPTAPSPTVRSVSSLVAGSMQGKTRLLVCSTEEKVVGTCSVVDRAVTFPKALKGVETPLLSVVGNFMEKGKPLLAVLHKDGDTQLQFFHQEGDEWQELGGQHSLGDNKNPKDVLVTDLDNDGVHEMLIFGSYSAPELYRVTGSGDEATLEQVSAPGVFEKCSRGATSVALNGDLLLSAGNHCRRVGLDDKGELVVRYQVNGVSSNSSIASAVEVRLGEPAQRYLALFDKSDNSLNLFSAEGSRPEFRRSFDGPFSTIQQATSADLDGDGRDEILLLDRTSLAVIRTAGERYTLESIFTYSNPDEDARYVMGATGDLNGDSVKDLVLSNGSLRKLQILKADKESPGHEGHWTHALRFPVYEAKSFSGRSSGALEPRWIHVTDLTSDGLEDLLILVHDRLILYPQDAKRS